jgi:RNA polymerase sigma factor (sigma-70 family)
MRRPAAPCLAIALVCLPLAGCGGGVDERKFERLKVGMTSQDVDAILGKGGKEIGPDEVSALMRDALTPKGVPGKAGVPKVELPDLSGARGVRWGDDKKSITVIYTGDRVSRLFEEARDDVYRYLLTLGLHPPRAQEAVQEVFLRLYATMKKGEEIENPRAWVFRVAHNYGLKLRERQATESSFDPGLEATLASPGENPEKALLQRERMVRFHNAVEGLSELNMSVDNESGSFISTAKVEGDKLIVTTHKVYKKTFDPKENWPNYLAFLEPAYKFSQLKVVFKKK